MTCQLLLTLLLLLSSPATSFNECEFLLESGDPFTLVCKAQVSAELKQSYRDRWIKANTPYWIWMRHRPMSQMLISFHHSAISPCENVTLSLNCLHCYQSDTPGEHIEADRIHCYDGRFAYIVALQKGCGMNTECDIEHIALHYAKRGPPESSGAAQTVPWGMGWPWESWMWPE
ncbi:hypothetical protein KR074_011501 [Drosophila pseudoananassae]|nr:hypothetical protein KR074_011501 [Drosophila pseudoananassae]